MVTSGRVKTLVQMLAHNRFDYFPQGALQIGRVLDNYLNKTNSIAENVLISYPSMTAFYVNKGNKKLAERLEYGLKQAYLDGSFNYFYVIKIYPNGHLSLTPHTGCALGRAMLRTAQFLFYIEQSRLVFQY